MAEVLITLGIISVVAVLTLPSLSASYRDQVIVNKLNATYSLLSQATTAMVNDLGDGGSSNVWGDYPLLTFAELLPNYLKVSQKVMDGAYSYIILPNGAKLILI